MPSDTAQAAGVREVQEGLCNTYPLLAASIVLQCQSPVGTLGLQLELEQNSRTPALCWLKL